MEEACCNIMLSRSLETTLGSLALRWPRGRRDERPSATSEWGGGRGYWRGEAAMRLQELKESRRAWWHLEEAIL